MFSQFDVNE
jgi:hypothetical protein